MGGGAEARRFGAEDDAAGLQGERAADTCRKRGLSAAGGGPKAQSTDHRLRRDHARGRGARARSGKRGKPLSQAHRRAHPVLRAGGRAHWEMLVYKHNEHQVKDCRDLAKRMCFHWFRTKVSRRFDLYPVEFLKPPTELLIPTRNFANSNNHSDIKCQALNDNSRYLSAKGILHPCCWLGGYGANNTLDKFEEIQKSWQTTPHPVCQRTCATVGNRNNFTNQWKSEEDLC